MKTTLRYDFKVTIWLLLGIHFSLSIEILYKLCNNKVHEWWNPLELHLSCTSPAPWLYLRIKLPESVMRELMPGTKFKIDSKPKPNRITLTEYLLKLMPQPEFGFEFQVNINVNRMRHGLMNFEYSKYLVSYCSLILMSTIHKKKK